VTNDILLTLAILLVTVVLLVSEKLRVDLIALLVLGSLALTGLVTPEEALSGFSNSAVVTVWAVFILGGALSRTGVANMLGRQLLRISGTSEIKIMVIIVLTAGILSAFMNNVGVVALLLPVVIHIARQVHASPSKLLMPLAFGALLGGMLTLIGTPPNILASEGLQAFGMQPFSFFNFAPVGIVILVMGIVFLVFIGRRLLPARDVTKELRETGKDSLRKAFGFQDRLVVLRLPEDSALAGKSLTESHIGSATGLNVIGIARNGQTYLSPDPGTVLHGNDRLLVSGGIERLEDLRGQKVPFIIDEQVSLDSLISGDIGLVEIELTPNSSLLGKTIQDVDFRNSYGFNVLSILRNKTTLQHRLPDLELRQGDRLLGQVNANQLDELSASKDFFVNKEDSYKKHSLNELLFAISIPEGSNLAGKTLVESRLGDAYGLSVLGVIRDDKTNLFPDPDEKILAGDVLLVEGQKENILMMNALQELEVEYDDLPDKVELESENVGLVEAVLSPQTKMVDKTLKQAHFREKYGLSILSIWRDGEAYRDNLRDMVLKFGDALLLHGPWEKLRVLAGEPDFILLSERIQEPPRKNKALIATLIMAGVVFVVVLGWFPIAIAAVIGSALMVLSGSLTMEEAYRYIDWRAVFLIAGMLPLGIAMETSGTASFLASAVVNFVGDYGSLAVLAGLFLMTLLASQFMPNAVVTVLMVPIAINTAFDMNISPYAIVMAVAIAASAAFLSPVGHPANVLIMGPGGYRFKDYLRVGIPLTLVVFVVTLIVLPIFWPLTP
jgi:di/tricarboxylate transporter